MKKILIPTLICIMMMSISCKNTKKQRPDYPVTAKVEQVDDYFGTMVEDPYRWLEDDMSEQTAEWVKAENKVTFDYLNQIPFRDKMKEKLTAQWNYPKSGSPFKYNGRWMMYKNTGLQNQSVLFLLKDINDKDGEILLDPNTLSDNGTVALSGIAVSKDGKTLIYSISREGSDWNEFLFMDIDSRENLEDHLKWIKFSNIEPYNDGVIYSRFPEPKEGDMLKGTNENGMVYFHKLGTPQTEDILLYSEPQNPLRSFNIYVSDDEQYMFLYSSESTSGNALAFKKTGDKNFIPIITECENDYSVIDVVNGKFYIYTNYLAPNYRVVEVDPESYDVSQWRDIIPEKDYVLKSCAIFGDKFLAGYLKDAHSLVQFYDLEGKYLYDLEAGIGTIGGFGGKREDTVTFYNFTSFTTPSIIYKYDIANNTSEEYSRSQINFDPDEYTTLQVFFESKDGTKIPMFITHKKGIKMNGKNPTLLYGYGGFNISMTPGFSLSRLPLLENNGILAVVNLRGGGEYGEKWHEAGTKMQKQNVFDDCIAAAEYLIANKYTSPDYLALQGGSNGGLLVGAVVNQRPDLFAVALPAVGVMDMLRYHKFTIGIYWA
ncbi:MAG: prolyl oligopeptidase family serine peptidase, partial [Bacteroidales bacterium]|nr:prolyl oligopeptidase family serine peptidase [Bacteroidales bacterium]